MNNYHREKLHVYHFWELKGKLIQKGYNEKNWNQQHTVELKIYISIKLIAKTVLWSYFVIGTGHHTSLIVNLQHWTLTIFWACVFISRNFSMHSFLTSKIFDNLVYKKNISLWNKYSQTLTSLNAHIHHSKCQGLVSIRISLNHEKHTTRMRNLIGKPPRVPPWEKWYKKCYVQLQLIFMKNVFQLP